MLVSHRGNALIFCLPEKPEWSQCENPSALQRISFVLLTHQVRKITTCAFLDGAGLGLTFYVTNRADYRSHSDITSFDDAIAASEQIVNFPVSNWPIKEVISWEAGSKQVGGTGGGEKRAKQLQTSSFLTKQSRFIVGNRPPK